MALVGLRRARRDWRRCCFGDGAMNYQNRLNGMDVIINEALDHVPKMTVTPRFAELMPEDWVVDLNKWMLNRFGTKSEIISMPMLGQIVMGPKTWARIKDSI